MAYRHPRGLGSPRTTNLRVSINRLWFLLCLAYCNVQACEHSGLKAVTQTQSIEDAHRNLLKLIRDPEHGETVELTRRGKLGRLDRPRYVRTAHRMPTWFR